MLSKQNRDFVSGKEGETSFGLALKRHSIIPCTRAETNRKLAIVLLASKHFEKWHRDEIPLMTQLSHSVVPISILWAVELGMVYFILFYYYYFLSCIINFFIFLLNFHFYFILLYNTVF